MSKCTGVTRRCHSISRSGANPLKISQKYRFHHNTAKSQTSSGLKQMPRTVGPRCGPGAGRESKRRGLSEEPRGNMKRLNVCASLTVKSDPPERKAPRLTVSCIKRTKRGQPPAVLPVSPPSLDLTCCPLATHTHTYSILMMMWRWRETTLFFSLPADYINEMTSSITSVGYMTVCRHMLLSAAGMPAESQVLISISAWLH